MATAATTSAVAMSMVLTWVAVGVTDKRNSDSLLSTPRPVVCPLLANQHPGVSQSFCRVKSLSLTGRLLYHSRMADRFVVHWPELCGRYPRAEHVGTIA